MLSMSGQWKKVVTKKKKKIRKRVEVKGDMKVRFIWKTEVLSSNPKFGLLQKKKKKLKNVL